MKIAIGSSGAKEMLTANVGSSSYTSLHVGGDKWWPSGRIKSIRLKLKANSATSGEIWPKLWHASSRAQAAASASNYILLTSPKGEAWHMTKSYNSTPVATWSIDVDNSLLVIEFPAGARPTIGAIAIGDAFTVALKAAAYSVTHTAAASALSGAANDAYYSYTFSKQPFLPNTEFSMSVTCTKNDEGITPHLDVDGIYYTGDTVSHIVCWFLPVAGTTKSFAFKAAAGQSGVTITYYYNGVVAAERDMRIRFQPKSAGSKTVTTISAFSITVKFPAISQTETFTVQSITKE